MLKDKELRKTIGSRAKSRRQELGLNQPYVAEKMGVTASTIQRYEAGTIDNTKKMTLEGLADALHVSVEWLKGETDEYETEPKYWSFSFNISPSNEHPGLISFRMDWLDLLAVQGTLKSLLQHHSSKASIFQCSAFFTVQLLHPYMTKEKP